MPLKIYFCVSLCGAVRRGLGGKGGGLPCLESCSWLDHRLRLLGEPIQMLVNAVERKRERGTNSEDGNIDVASTDHGE
jgi:hypothetical protein